MYHTLAGRVPVVVQVLYLCSGACQRDRSDRENATHNTHMPYIAAPNAHQGTAGRSRINTRTFLFVLKILKSSPRPLTLSHESIPPSPAFWFSMEGNFCNQTLLAGAVFIHFLFDVTRQWLSSLSLRINVVSSNGKRIFTMCRLSWKRYKHIGWLYLLKLPVLIWVIELD